MRDDFSPNVKDKLAKRVGMLCSNPDCGKSTSGPQEDPTKVLNIGVAAHITAASPGFARYDPSLTKDERSSIENGIWLCQNCAKLVDNDEKRYRVVLLKRWKESQRPRRLYSFNLLQLYCNESGHSVTYRKRISLRRILFSS
jgi:hypothetical protein